MSLNHQHFLSPCPSYRFPQVPTKTSRRVLGSDLLAAEQWKVGISYGGVLHHRLWQLTEFTCFTLKCAGQISFLAVPLEVVHYKL